MTQFVANLLEVGSSKKQEESSSLRSSIGYLGGADKDKHEKKKGKDRHKCYLYDDEEHLEV